MFCPPSSHSVAPAKHQHPGQRHDEDWGCANRPPNSPAPPRSARPRSASAGSRHRPAASGPRSASAATAPVKAATDPTDRSIWPDTITSSMPRARMMTWPFCRKRLVMFGAAGTSACPAAAPESRTEHHDGDQRQQHAVFAQMPAQMRAYAFLLPSAAFPAVLSDVFHDQRHDLFLTGLVAGQLAHDPAFVHHIDPVAHAQKLGHFRRDHHAPRGPVRPVPS